MFRGNWLLCTALVGFLALGAHQQCRAANKQNQLQQSTARNPSTPITPNAKSSDGTQRSCYPESQPRISCDGIAAKAAVDQATDADKQTALIWPQFGVGIFTLIGALVAAIFAGVAAHHTKRSADAANNGQRAWVTLEIQPKRVTPSAAGLDFEVDFAAQNIGQTTATHFCFNTELFFIGPSEDSNDFSKRIENKIDEWVLEYTNPASVLLPNDIEINSFWQFRQSSQISWWNGAVSGKDVARPIFVALVLYRTTTHPEIVQQSWRSWYLAELDERGKFTAFIGISIEPISAEKLGTRPFRVNLTHKEYLANDRSRE